MFYRSLISMLIVLLFIAAEGCQTIEEKEQENSVYLNKGDAYFAQGDYRMAYEYYSQGIPLLLMPKEGDEGSQYSGGRIRLDAAGSGKKDSIMKISIDTKAEECFYKAMDCLMRLDPGYYSKIISNYERYIDVFPNYSGMDDVEINIKHIINKFEIMGEVDGAIRGYRLLIKIDPFSIEGRNAHFTIGNHYFAQERFLMAIEYFKDILTYFPGDSRIPDVLFKLGVSHFRLFRGLYYDYEDVELSLKYFERFLNQADDEKQIKLANMYIAEIKNKKAEKLLYKAKFYLRRGDVTAGRGYLKEIQTEYASTVWEGQANELIKTLPLENGENE